MKKFTLSLLSLLAAATSLTTSPALADDLRIAATMQRCSTNEECTLVTNSCQDNCGFVPVHKENLPALQGQYQARCGKTMEANPSCNLTPPIAAACVNARCTIDYAYANNASAGDYQSGTYAVPEAPVPSNVPADAYKDIDDKHGFTAYNLPQDKVREGTVGTLHTTIYVPPSAPVSGGSYVPVAPQAVTAPVLPPATVPVPVPAPAVAAPAIPAPAVDAATGYAPAIPAPAVHTQVPVAPPAPTAVVPPVPAYVPQALPGDIPAMTPSAPNQLPPTEYSPEAAAPAAPVAVPTQPYQYVAPETIVEAPPAPALPYVPVAPPGSQPIPPSDLKPLPTFVPPAGDTIPVNPEDPGAPPPKGSGLILKDGKLGVATATTVQKSDKGKSFTAQPPGDTKAQKLGSFN